MGGMTYWVRALLIANIAVFMVIQSQPQIAGILAFAPSLILKAPWTLITYQFVHANFGHIFFNMWALYMFGPPVESRLGRRNFIQLYLFSGIVGGLLTLVLDPFAARVFLVGASGAVFGVALAFARYWPETRILLFFVLPISARGMVIGLTVLSLVGGYGPFQGGVGHFAHLGGFVGAFFYLRWLEKRSPAAQFKRKAFGHIKPSLKVDSSLLERIERVDRGRLHSLNREEFDRVVAKIKAEGIRGLTLDERAFLDRFS